MITILTEDRPTRPFELEELLARCVGNVKFAHRVLSRFAGCFGEDLGRVEEHLQANSYDEAARVVHTMRGAAASVGAHRLEEQLAFLEGLARARESAELPSQLAMVREEWSRVAESISQIGQAGESA
jgi:HPt (histidine-containing phosphotransfer) domain-containing protein